MDWLRLYREKLVILSGALAGFAAAAIIWSLVDGTLGVVLGYAALAVGFAAGLGAVRLLGWAGD